MASAGLYQDSQDLKKHGKRVLKAPGNNSENPILAGSRWQDDGQHSENYQQRRPQEKGASVAESKHATSESREAGRLNKLKYTSGSAPFATQEQYPFTEGTAIQYNEALSFADGADRASASNGVPTPGRTLAKAPVSDYNPITWGVDESDEMPNETDSIATSMPQRFKGRGPENASLNNGYAKNKASTHNPLTWERYDGAEAEIEKPANRLRPGQNNKSNYNPITGQDGDDDVPSQQQHWQHSRRV